MTPLAGLILLLVVSLGLYYLRIHLAWRKEVRRRRAEREKEREQRGYRTYSLH